MKPEFWDISDIEQRKSLLWEHINNLVRQAKEEAGLDANAHAKITSWNLLKQLPPEVLAELGIDDPLPEWRLRLLAINDKWSDSIWMMYYALKAQLVETGDADLPDVLPPCPVTFGQLLLG